MSVDDRSPAGSGDGHADLVPDSASVLGRIFDHLGATVHALAEQRHEFEIGWGVRSHELSRIWTLNQLCVTAPASLGDVVALAESHQSDLPFRHVNIEHEETGRRLAGPLAEAGWHMDREVVMVLSASPDRSVDTAAVVELAEEEMIALMRRWGMEERPTAPPGEIDQINEYNRREGRLWDETSIGVPDHDGIPAAVTKVRSNGTIGWVEDVYTVPEARGRGYARMLVTHALKMLRAGEHELTFIIADDNDWPKHLYAKLGFRPAGFVHAFHLDLVSQA